jgi:hypothetical protein
MSLHQNTETVAVRIITRGLLFQFVSSGAVESDLTNSIFAGIRPEVASALNQYLLAKQAYHAIQRLALPSQCVYYGVEQAAYEAVKVILGTTENAKHNAVTALVLTEAEHALFNYIKNLGYQS